MRILVIHASERGENMNRFTSGLIGGLAVGLIIGATAMTDERDRRKLMRDGKRTLRKAGHLVDDIKSKF